jgi:hypothetical protein
VAPVTGIDRHTVEGFTVYCTKNKIKINYVKAKRGTTNTSEAMLIICLKKPKSEII